MLAHVHPGVPADQEVPGEGERAAQSRIPDQTAQDRQMLRVIHEEHAVAWDNPFASAQQQDGQDCGDDAMCPVVANDSVEHEKTLVVLKNVYTT